MSKDGSGGDECQQPPPPQELGALEDVSTPDLRQSYHEQLGDEIGVVSALGHLPSPSYEVRCAYSPSRLHTAK